MRVIVTCGPAYAPIDAVRRITNFSTGSLGVQLANAFAAAGHSVLCLRGELATTPLPLAGGVECAAFTTNDDLAARLREAAPGAGAIFHAAALCDYEVAAAADENGAVLDAPKIPSRAGGLSLTLRPALKVLPLLRGWFPRALLVGWKYELNGARRDALAAGERQLAEAATDLCVVNGAAYGAGFGILARGAEPEHAGDRAALCRALVSRLPS